MIGRTLRIAHLCFIRISVKSYDSCIGPASNLLKLIIHFKRAYKGDVARVTDDRAGRRQVAWSFFGLVDLGEPHCRHL